MFVSVYAKRIVTGCECCACVGESWRCESLAGATGVFDVKSVSCSMFLIFAIVCVVPQTILECQSACLYPLNKSDFLSEICSVSFKNK